MKPYRVLCCTSPPLCSVPCAVLYLATSCAVLYLLLMYQDTLGGEGEECATIVRLCLPCCPCVLVTDAG